MISQVNNIRLSLFFWFAMLQKIKSFAEYKAKRALEKRAEADKRLVEITRKYEASLEEAAKKCVEAMKHLEPYLLGNKRVPKLIENARSALFLAIHFMVKAGVNDPRKAMYVTQKNDSSIKSLISKWKKLENDNLLDYKRSYDNLDAGRKSSVGRRSSDKSNVE